MGIVNIWVRENKKTIKPHCRSTDVNGHSVNNTFRRSRKFADIKTAFKTDA